MQDLAQLAVILLCDDSTGCEERDDYFATEAGTIIDYERMTWMRISFGYLYFTETLFKCETIIFDTRGL